MEKLTPVAVVNLYTHSIQDTISVDVEIKFIGMSQDQCLCAGFEASIPETALTLSSIDNRYKPNNPWDISADSILSNIYGTQLAQKSNVSYDMFELNLVVKRGKQIDKNLEKSRVATLSKSSNTEVFLKLFKYMKVTKFVCYQHSENIHIPSKTLFDISSLDKIINQLLNKQLHRIKAD